LIEIVLFAAAWCVLALLVFAFTRPALRANRREDAHELHAAEELMIAAVPMARRPAAGVSLAPARERTSHLLESGYLGLVHDRLCGYARVVLGVERSWLLLRQPRRAGEVVVAASRGSDPEQVGRSLPADLGVMGLLLSASRPEVLAPRAGVAGEDPITSVARGVHTMATAPVSWEGTVQGALAVGTRDAARELDMEDLALLGEVAWLSGAALAGRERRAELAGTVSSQVDALATALAVWDRHTRRHSDMVVELARTTGARMGLDSMELLELELAALLHDVGKLRVPRELLQKPGPLSGTEERLLRNHPAWGAELVAGVPGLQAVALVVRHHHERVDGSGYPNGLSGVRIPVGSRIMAVCDAYGAMTEARPYQEPREPQEALAELRDLAGSKFDPAVVDALEAEVGATARETLVFS
jgi:HD-GYP domain-containing protein (c-di-GMP phosphodiesterase class II)